VLKYRFSDPAACALSCSNDIACLSYSFHDDSCYHHHRDDDAHPIASFDEEEASDEFPCLTGPNPHDWIMKTTSAEPTPKQRMDLAKWWDWGTLAALPIAKPIALAVGASWSRS
jgi:hypothetical protein